MPANPNKTRCSIPGCRAWAIRDSDPPLCSPHAGRPIAHAVVGPGAPSHNQNARTHGFYSSMIAIADLLDLAACSDRLTLDAEIACARVVLRGLLGQLRDFRHGSPADYARLAGLALEGMRTISHLLRTKHTLGIDAAATAGVADRALSDLQEQWQAAQAE